MNNKHSVNLLQPELIPIEPLWTLNRVALLWAIAFVVMLLWTIVSQIMLNSTQSEQKELNRTNKGYKAQVSQLEGAIKAHKPKRALLERLEKLKLLMANKSFMQKQLTDGSRTYVSGFSSAMTELSELHHKDISLQQVFINVDAIQFRGFARKPNVVPAWLAGFEKSQFLSGKNFVDFTLVEHENNYIEFTVSSDVKTQQEAN